MFIFYTNNDKKQSASYLWLLFLQRDSLFFIMYTGVSCLLFVDLVIFVTCMCEAVYFILIMHVFELYCFGTYLPTSFPFIGSTDFAVLTLFIFVHILWTNTLRKTNVAPENRPSQKEVVFQPSIFRGELLVPWAIGTWKQPNHECRMSFTVPRYSVGIMARSLQDHKWQAALHTVSAAGALSTGGSTGFHVFWNVEQKSTCS